MKTTPPTAGSLGITLTAAQLLAGYSAKPANVPGWVFTAWHEATRKAFPITLELRGEAYDTAKAALAESWVRDTLPDLPAEMLNDWEPEVRSLFDRLARHGFTVISVDNGETHTKAMAGRPVSDHIVAETIACDEATIHVKRPDGQTVWLSLVLGNSPGEIVSDWSFKNSDGQDGNPVDPLQAVSNEHGEEWEGKDQPFCVSRY